MAWVNWDFISVQRCWCRSLRWSRSVCRASFYLSFFFFLRWPHPLRLWGIWLSSWCRTTWPEQRWRRGQMSCPSRSLWSNSYRGTSEYRMEDSPSPSDPRCIIVFYHNYFCCFFFFFWVIFTLQCVKSILVLIKVLDCSWSFNHQVQEITSKKPIWRYPITQNFTHQDMNFAKLLVSCDSWNSSGGHWRQKWTLIAMFCFFLLFFFLFFFSRLQNGHVETHTSGVVSLNSLSETCLISAHEWRQLCHIVPKTSGQI